MLGVWTSIFFTDSNDFIRTVIVLITMTIYWTGVSTLMHAFVPDGSVIYSDHIYFHGHEWLFLHVLRGHKDKRKLRPTRICHYYCVCALQCNPRVQSSHLCEYNYILL
jgi:hypothetical protein